MELTSTTVLFGVISSLVALSAVFIFLPALAQTNNTTSTSGTNMTDTNMTSAGNQTLDNATGLISSRGVAPS